MTSTTTVDAKPKIGAERDWRTVTPFIIGLCAFAALAIWNETRDFDLWRNYALVGILLGAPSTYAVYRTDVRVPHRVQWIITTACLLHYGGGSLGSPGPHGTPGALGMHGVNGAYHVFPWWDNLTHFAGMGAAAIAIAYTLDVYQLRRRLGWTPRIVGGFAFVSALAVGVGVELYEFLGKTMFQTIDQGGYSNTMWDLVWNFIGAGTGTLYAVTVDRHVLWPKMQARWGEQAEPARDWLPPNMMGYVAFILPPALMATFLAVRFLFMGDVGTMEAYDSALTMVTLSAGAGIVAGPVVATGARYRRARVADVEPVSR